MVTDTKYDTTPDAYSTHLELADNLDEVEVEEALKLAQYAKGGVMIIVSPPRSGKDLLGHVLTWKLKRYFKNYQITKDEKPREPYGEYNLFSRELVLNDLVRMQTKATGGIPGNITKGKESLEDYATVSKRSPKQLEQAEKMADLWVEAQKDVVLKKGALYIQEFWRYLLNRRPGDRFGIVLSGIMKQWGHLDLLVIGSAQLLHELDEFSCKPYINWIVQCRPSETNENPAMPTKFVYHIQKVQFLGHRKGKAQLEPVGRPFITGIDGAKPRPEVGFIRINNNYKLVSTIERFIYKSCVIGMANIDTVVNNIEETIRGINIKIEQDPKLLHLEREKIELLSIKYKDVYQVILDMHEREIIKCMRDFDLFNSKSAPQMVNMAKGMDL